MYIIKTIQGQHVAHADSFNEIMKLVPYSSGCILEDTTQPNKITLIASDALADELMKLLGIKSPEVCLN